MLSTGQGYNWQDRLALRQSARILSNVRFCSRSSNRACSPFCKPSCREVRAGQTKTWELSLRRLGFPRAFRERRLVSLVGRDGRCRGLRSVRPVCVLLPCYDLLPQKRLSLLCLAFSPPGSKRRLSRLESKRPLGESIRQASVSVRRANTFRQPV